MSKQSLVAILKSKETWFAALFIINAVAVALGFSEFKPDANTQAIAGLIVNVVAAIAAIYLHPVVQGK